MLNFSPTPYSEVNDALALLLRGVQSVLGGELVGLYLHGSLAAGDFTPGRSDIDFVAATRQALTADQVAGLVKMHAGVTNSGLEWARVMEGSYVPLRALRRYDSQDCHFPALRVDGSFDIDGHGPDWIIQCSTLRAHGIALYGPAIQTLIDPITPQQLIDATTGTLREWWAPVLSDPARLETAEYRAYTVLTMCRGLFTIANGRVGAKSEAANWAAQGPVSAYASMIRRALAWRHGMAMDAAAEGQGLVRATRAQAGCLPE